MSYINVTGKYSIPTEKKNHNLDVAVAYQVTH